MRPRSIISAAATLAGAVVIVLGCLVPYAHVCDVCPINTQPSLFNDEGHRVSWLATEPIAALVLAVIGVLVLLAVRRAVERAIVGGLLTAVGLLTSAFFMTFVGTFDKGSAAGIVGGVGGLLVTLGGMAAASGVLREAARVDIPE